ncbi:calcium-binding protein [Puniceibacterium sp. IMCC21224]|uniref:calcium-binding protein n=1 Tax=Puniceibacterium sp. IMCC21224 TaxID=1618204 RepID=UPI00065D10C0|nr:calcium-binding protein [Puniceibacterium sp. IMCC21224]KMK68076.1 putative calcium-binding protein [Puniceibacterium sp. IMCC21224]
MIYVFGLLMMTAMSVLAVSDSSDEDETSDGIGGANDKTADTGIGPSSEAFLQMVAASMSSDLSDYEQQSSIYGRASPDTLEGTESDDILWGRGEDDDLYGLEGSDTILGGTGSDLVVSHTGDDLVYGEDGNDALHGRGGQDTMIGGSGSDSLFGSSGNDILVGGTGQDFLSGGDGEDVLVGERGDSLHGGNGEDFFVVDALEGDEPAELLDFDPIEDRLVLLVDDSGCAQISVGPNLEDRSYSEIFLNGQVVAVVSTDAAPTSMDVELLNRRLFSATL